MKNHTADEAAQAIFEKRFEKRKKKPGGYEPITLPPKKDRGGSRPILPDAGAAERRKKKGKAEGELGG